MQLTTSRLVVKEITIEDLDKVHEMNSIPEVDQYNTLGLPESIDTTRKLVEGWIKEQDTEPRMGYTLSIRLKDSDGFVGMIGLMLSKPKYKKAEVWYKLHPGYWGKGYMTEVLSEILRFAFSELALHRVEAGVATGNAASVKVLEKAGMSREGLCRQILPIRGEWVDNYMYAILDTDG